ncbi:MAG: 3'(2'),5'-bisphosphate nucleotidase [Planctomycetota bacterium]
MKTTERRMELDLAVAAVRAAARATRAVQASLDAAGTLHKGDKSPVTVADFAAQAVVARTLMQALPGDAIVGEEDAAALREGAAAPLCARVVEAVSRALGEPASREAVLQWVDRGGAAGDTARYWTLDPIDGTKGFLRGGQYAIALALIEHGEVQVAALGCPSYAGAEGAAPGLVLFATRDGGAYELPLDGSADAEPRRLRVADTAAWGHARFCESVESGHSDQGHSAAVATALGITREPLRMDSQAKYAAVARGDADVYMRLPTRADYREKIWDHAAGLLVLQEAGGTVTDVDGRPLDFGHGRTLQQNQGVLASSGRGHEQLVAAVRAVLGR